MLTLVPARGGSKRLPRKNIRPLAGVPLLLWTLIPFRHLNPVVSSEDAGILALAREYGFRTIERPAVLATDEASSVDVALHSLEQTGEDSVLLLQPTSPFRSRAVVDGVLKHFGQTGKPTLTVRGVPHAFHEGFHLPGVETPTGSAYAISRADLEVEKSFAPYHYVPVQDTSVGALDIDDADQWLHAEAIAQTRVASLNREMVFHAGWAA